MDLNRVSSKRDMGIAGLVVVLSQLVSTYQTSQNVTAELQDLRSDIQQIRADQDLHFVKKEQVLVLSKKMDKMNRQMARLNKQIQSLRSEYAVYDDQGHPIIGCVLEGNKDVSPI